MNDDLRLLLAQPKPSCASREDDVSRPNEGGGNPTRSVAGATTGDQRQEAEYRPRHAKHGEGMRLLLHEPSLDGLSEENFRPVHPSSAERLRSDTTGRSPGVVCSALDGLFWWQRCKKAVDLLDHRRVGIFFCEVALFDLLKGSARGPI